MRHEVAAICYRLGDGMIEFLLVRSTRGDWTIPKGGVEPGEAPWKAAEREALEEAGAMGSASHRPFATVRTDGVDAFLVRVDRRHRPAERHREPTWFRSDEAERALTACRHSAEAADAWRWLVREACRAIAEESIHL